VTAVQVKEQVKEGAGSTETKKASEWLRDPSLDAQVNMLQFNGYIGDNPGKGIKQFTGHGPKDDQVQARNPMYFTDILKYIMKKLGDVNVTGFMQAGPAPAMEAELAEAGGGYEKKTASEWLKDPRLETQVLKLQAPGINITNSQKGLSGYDMYSGGMGNPSKDLYTDAKDPMYFKQFLTHVMKKIGDIDVIGVLQAGPAPAMEQEQEPAMALESTDTEKSSCNECGMTETECKCNETMAESLARFRTLAGIQEAAKPDFPDLDDDGNKKEPIEKAAKDAKDKKVEESILAMTNLWRAYKG
jgi:hypothetical protein